MTGRVVFEELREIERSVRELAAQIDTLSATVRDHDKRIARLVMEARLYLLVPIVFLVLGLGLVARIVAG